ncbi:hypothetical protein HDU84_009374 [Entophlyctis sp. JEL0112]|nr:hypothetical protein HDU84_009374 [Entophlyctis sp. JEL0112]
MKSKCRFRKVKEEEDSEKGCFWSLNPAEPFFKDSIENAWETVEKLETWQGILYYKLNSSPMHHGVSPVQPTLFSEDDRRFYPDLYCFEEHGVFTKFKPNTMAACPGISKNLQNLDPRFPGYIRGCLPIPLPPYRNVLVLNPGETLIPLRLESSSNNSSSGSSGSVAHNSSSSSKHAVGKPSVSANKAGSEQTATSARQTAATNPTRPSCTVERRVNCSGGGGENAFGGLAGAVPSFPQEKVKHGSHRDSGAFPKIQAPTTDDLSESDESFGPGSWHEFVDNHLQATFKKASQTTTQESSKLDMTSDHVFSLFNDCAECEQEPSLLFGLPDQYLDKFTLTPSFINVSCLDIESLIADPNVSVDTVGGFYDVAVDGYKSSALFVAIKNALAGPGKSDAIKKVNGVFHLVVKNAAGKENTWTIDLKEKGDVLLGAEGKADITISLSDDTFVDLADGKINGQKAFMAGKLKVKGNIGLATKLDTVLKAAKTAAPAPAPAAPAAASAPASDTVNVPGFESGALFAEIEDGLKTSPKAQLEAAVKKVKAVFQFDVKNAAGTVQTWTLDLKNGTGSIVKGTGAKADVTIAVGDKDFVDLANGKLNGQKAFMSGKIKVKGQIMLATKLDSVSAEGYEAKSETLRVSRRERFDADVIVNKDLLRRARDLCQLREQRDDLRPNMSAAASAASVTIREGDFASRVSIAAVRFESQGATPAARSVPASEHTLRRLAEILLPLVPDSSPSSTASAGRRAFGDLLLDAHNVASRILALGLASKVDVVFDSSAELSESSSSPRDSVVVVFRLTEPPLLNGTLISAVSKSGSHSVRMIFYFIRSSHLFP